MRYSRLISCDFFTKFISGGYAGPRFSKWAVGFDDDLDRLLGFGNEPEALSGL